MLAREAGSGLFQRSSPWRGCWPRPPPAPDDDLALLPAFHDVDPQLLAQSFRFRSPAKAFTTRPDLPLDPATRQRLTTTFSAWGLWTAIQVAREVPAIPAQRRVLDERSGVAGLRELVRNHFGVRSGTLRVKEAISEVLAVNRRYRLRMPDGLADRAVLDDVGTRLERLQGRFRARFLHMDVLGAHYRNELILTPAQANDVLRLTGERGEPRRPARSARRRHPRRAAGRRGRARRAVGAARRRVVRPTRRTAEDLQRSCDSLIQEVDELATRPPGAA